MAPTGLPLILSRSTSKPFKSPGGGGARGGGAAGGRGGALGGGAGGGAGGMDGGRLVQQPTHGSPPCAFLQWSRRMTGRMPRHHIRNC